MVASFFRINISDPILMFSRSAGIQKMALTLYKSAGRDAGATRTKLQQASLPAAPILSQ